MKQIVDRKIESLIEDIHQASFEPNLLKPILESITEMFSCHTTGIISCRAGQKGPILSDSFGIDSKFLKQYNEYFNMLDPSFTVLSNKPLQVVADHVTDRNIPKGNSGWREFAFDFIRPQGNVYTAAIDISSNLDQVQRSWIWTRTARQGHFNDNEVSQLNRLGFHMSNAYARLQASKGYNYFQDEKYVRLSELTQRELDVLKLIATGNSRSFIAKELKISVHTIDEHRKHIRNKLSEKHLNDDVAKCYLDSFGKYK